MSTTKKGFSPGDFIMPNRVGICHRIINIFFSSIFGSGMLVGAAIALQDAPGTEFDIEELYGITVAGVCVTAVQLIICIPYAVITHKKGGRYMHYAFAAYHLFSFAASITLFFLAFYLVEKHSQDLRKNFWAQFKFKVDQVPPYMTALITFTDFAGLNSIFTLLIVIFPSVSKVWNRDHDTHVQIPLE